MSGSESEPLEVVRRCFAAWDRGDVEGVLAEYGADVEVDATRIAEGTYRGKDAVRAFYTEIFDAATFTNEDLTYSVEGEEVLAVTRLTGSGARSGAPLQGQLAYRFTVRDATVRRVVFLPAPNR